jgi:hypothetical protein
MKKKTLKNKKINKMNGGQTYINPNNIRMLSKYKKQLPIQEFPIHQIPIQEQIKYYQNIVYELQKQQEQAQLQKEQAQAQLQKEQAQLQKEQAKAHLQQENKFYNEYKNKFVKLSKSKKKCSKNNKINCNNRFTKPPHHYSGPF